MDIPLLEQPPTGRTSVYASEASCPVMRGECIRSDAGECRGMRGNTLVEAQKTRLGFTVVGDPSWSGEGRKGWESRLMDDAEGLV